MTVYDADDGHDDDHDNDDGDNDDDDDDDYDNDDHTNNTPQPNNESRRKQRTGLSELLSNLMMLTGTQRLPKTMLMAPESVGSKLQTGLGNALNTSSGCDRQQRTRCRERHSAVTPTVALPYTWLVRVTFTKMMLRFISQRLPLSELMPLLWSSWLLQLLLFGELLQFTLLILHWLWFSPLLLRHLLLWLLPLRSEVLLLQL